MPDIDDSLSARITTSCPEAIREVLLHAWSHDNSALKQLLSAGDAASVQDPQTGETPLHAAIRACGKAAEDTTEEDGEEDGAVEEAREAVQELFFSGAIWNDVDSNNETPGCVALRLGQKSLYQMCVDAGVRAELLFGMMDGYEKLSSAGEEDDEMEDESKEGNGESKIEEANGSTEQETKPEEAATFVPPDANEKTVTSEEYLQSNLTYDADKLVDSDLNGVMMAWETDIMRRSVDALIPNTEQGKRILNIGFGMGIIDGMFAELKPSRHHIIEAHPAVLEHVSGPDSKFGPSWEASGPEQGAYKIHAGKWQDIVPQLVEQGEQYDAIYFDTFGEDYGELKTFFMEHVPVLLDFDGRFSFFNGLGADRKICYDVYTKVVEMNSEEAGMDVEWEEIPVDMSKMEEAGKGEWEGVRRRYWTLDTYRLPTFTLMG